MFLILSYDSEIAQTIRAFDAWSGSFLTCKERFLQRGNLQLMKKLMNQ